MAKTETEVVFPRLIAVWGNNGSGKSTLAIKLAIELSERGKNVILVDTDFNAPQLNSWYPRLEVDKSSSLSVLLDNNVDTEAVANKIQVIDKNLGVLGYCKDFASNAVPGRADTAQDLLLCLPDLCDVAVIDCQSSIISDVLSFEALSSAEMRIVAITPDVRGLAWYDANVRMMDEEWRNNKKSLIKAFNKVRPTSPANEVENIIGTVRYYLPNSPALEDEVFTGELGGTDYRKTAKKYAKVVDTMVTGMAKTI